MKIVVITGSPHKKGTSALLADEFIKGAVGAGHEVTRFDAAFRQVHPCIACYHCRREGDGQCIYRDDMDTLKALLLAADCVVLVTPLYYSGMSAQLKRVIDRFYAFNAPLRESPKKALMLATAADTDTWVMDGLVIHFRLLCRYLHWEELKSLRAYGVYHPEDMEATDYAAKARRLGETLA